MTNDDDIDGRQAAGGAHVAIWAGAAAAAAHGGRTDDSSDDRTDRIVAALDDAHG